LNDLIDKAGDNDNEEDDFEDEVVFRPVFPRASLDQTSPFSFSRHETPSAQKSTPEPDIFGALGQSQLLTSTNSDNVWSKFGIGFDSNKAHEGAQASQGVTSTWGGNLFSSNEPLSGLSIAFGGTRFSSSLPLSSWDAPLPSISALSATSAPPGLGSGAAPSSLPAPPGLKSAAGPPPGLGGDRKVSRGESFLANAAKTGSWTT